jgi:Mrp family chromosome partitioning ATPase/capsular polysaccharide biosynthesis protein
MNDTTDATAIFAPLWKRKWLILIVGVLVAAGTYVYYKHKPPVYAASTEIYLGGGSEVQALIGNTQANGAESDRSIADQVVLINSSLVGNAVERRLLRRHDLVAARGTAEASSSAAASSSGGSDFITISSKAGSAAGAADLANTYARVYLRQREANYRKNIETALASTSQQLQVLQAGHVPTASQTLQVQDLVARIDQLRSQLSLGDAGDQQIGTAIASLTPLSPKPTRNAIFGFALGVVLAAIAAYALSRFDRRLRSLADIEEICQASVLTAVPSIRRPIIRPDGQPLPAQALREPMRRLHTTLQLRGVSDNLNGRSTPRSVLFVSADAGDGKSTLAAGLALVQGEAGARVVIVESDLRRPIQAELLGVDGSQGLAEVLAGTLTVQETLQVVQAVPVESASGSIDSGEGVATLVRPRETGSVSLLPSGGMVANPPALLAGNAMPTLLRSLAADFDYVLIDAPPPLEVSDVLPLMTMVDAIVMVARVGHTEETSARRLVDLLSRAPHAPVVGAVANDASSADMEAFGFSSVYYDERGHRS